MNVFIGSHCIETQDQFIHSLGELMEVKTKTVEVEDEKKGKKRKERRKETKS